MVSTALSGLKVLRNLSGGLSWAVQRQDFEEQQLSLSFWDEMPEYHWGEQSLDQVPGRSTQPVGEGSLVWVGKFYEP